MAKKDLTEKQKWMISFLSALLFLLIASSFMYNLTGSLTSMIGFQTSCNGCPNIWGLVLHAVVFAILIRVLMLFPSS